MPRVLDYKLVVDAGTSIAKIKRLGDALLGVGQQGTRSFTKFNASATRLGKTFDGLERTLGRLQRTMVAIAGVWAAREIIRGFTSLVDIAVEYNKTMERAKLGIGAVLAAQTKIVDSAGKELEGREKIVAAQTIGVRVARDLLIANKTTAATYQQLLTMFQQALPHALAEGFSIKQVEDFTVAMSQAATAMGIPLNMMAEEMRAMLKGTITAKNTLIATALGMDKAVIKALQGHSRELYNYIMKYLQAFKNSAVDIQRSWDGLISNMKDSLSRVLGAETTEFFNYMKNVISALTKGLDTPAVKKFASALNEFLITTVQRAITAISGLVQVILVLDSEFTAIENLYARMRVHSKEWAAGHAEAAAKRGHPVWKFWGGVDEKYVAEQKKLAKTLRDEADSYRELVAATNEHMKNLDIINKERFDLKDRLSLAKQTAELDEFDRRYEEMAAFVIGENYKIKKSIGDALASLSTEELNKFAKSYRDEISLLQAAPEGPKYFSADYEALIKQGFQEEELTLRLKKQLAEIVGNKANELEVTKQLYDLELNRLLDTKDLTEEQRDLVKQIAEARKKMLDEGRKAKKVELDSSDIDKANKKLEEFTQKVETAPKELSLDVKSSGLDRAATRLAEISAKIDEINSKSVNVKMTGEASPRRPLLETLTTVSNKFGDLIGQVSNSNIAANFDFSKIGDLVDSLLNVSMRAGRLHAGVWNLMQDAELYLADIPPTAWVAATYDALRGDLMESVEMALASAIIRSAGYEFTPPPGVMLATRGLYFNPRQKPSPVGGAGGGFSISPGAFQINVYSDTENLVELAEKVEDAIASNIRTGRSKIFEALNEVVS